MSVAVDGLTPEWPAPTSVCAFSTFRGNGVSRGTWRSLNLADHVGDDPAAVAANRRRLRVDAQLPGDPHWLEQVHGCAVVVDPRGCRPRADSVVTDRPGWVCPVLTADCLPVLLCNRAGSRVAAIHAGWRGLAAGVIERTLARFGEAPNNVLAWLGPAIGPKHFVVGEAVRLALVGEDSQAAVCFRADRPGYWLADLYALARRRLQRQGVTAVYGAHWCTFSDASRFFSYRRDGVTGRMATLIWIEPGNAR